MKELTTNHVISSIFLFWGFTEIQCSIYTATGIDKWLHESTWKHSSIKVWHTTSIWKIGNLHKGTVFDFGFGTWVGVY